MQKGKQVFDNYLIITYLQTIHFSFIYFNPLKMK